MAHNRKTLIGIGLEGAASWKLTIGGFKTVGDKAAKWRWLTARPGLEDSLIKSFKPPWNRIRPAN